MTKPTKMSLQEQLHHYVRLGEEACSLAKETVNGISHRFQAEGRKPTLQDRVVFGLAQKLYYAFKALLDDAERGRPEAMHHLKTLVESFIYLHWVGQRKDDQSAKLLLAKVCKEKVTFFRNNLNYPSQAELLDVYETELNNFIRGIEGEWDKFEPKGILKLADETGLGEIYRRIYKLACEPAHITDLPEQMPLPEGPITFDQTKISILRAYVALDYGPTELVYGLQEMTDEPFNAISLNS